MIRLALMFATAASLATPVLAQSDGNRDRSDKSEIGTRFKFGSEPMATTEIRRFQKKMMRCLVGNDRDLARELLRKSDPVSIDHAKLSMDYNAMMDEMELGKCIGRAMPRSARRMQVRYQPSVMRNLIAEEIYLYDNKEPLAIAEDDPEYLNNRYYAGGRSYTMAEVPSRLADCIVYKSPAQAHELIDSNPTGGGEKEAAEALSDTVDGCLPEGDSEITFTVSQMRAFVADGLWARSYYGKLASGNVTVEGEGSE